LDQNRGKPLADVLKQSPNIFRSYLIVYEASRIQLDLIPSLFLNMVFNCDVICDKVPYCGTNIVGPDQSLRYLSLVST